MGTSTINKLLTDEVRHISISLNEVLESGTRFEATRYDNRGRKSRHIISKYKGKKITIKEIIKKSFVPPPTQRNYTDDKKIGTPYLTPSDLLFNRIKPQKLVLARKIKNIKDWYVKRDWLLVTQSGLVGVPIITTKEMENYVISQNAIRLIFQNNIDTAFIYVFLKSKIGKSIVESNFYGSVITHIEPEHLEEITIPYPEEKIRKSISEKIIKSIRLREESTLLLEQAEKIISEKLSFKQIDDLKIKYFKKSKIRNFVVDLKNLDLRFDATFHTPLSNTIIKEIKSNNNYFHLGDKKISKSISLPKRFKRIYVDEKFGLPFLGSKNIMQFDPQGINYLSKKMHENIIDEILLEENMILISRSGTIGNVVLTPNHLHGSTASEHIIRIIPNNQIHVGYLYTYLASNYGQELIKRLTFGSVVDEIDVPYISSIPIILPSEKIMNEIGEKAITAHKNWSKAFELEQAAIEEFTNELMNNPTGK